MSDEGPRSLLPVALPVGAVAGWEFVKWLLFGRLKRGEELEAKAESATEQKLDLLLEKVTSIETEQRVAVERAAALDSVVREVKGRIDGLSANYGVRLGEIEQRLAALEGRRRR